MPDRGVPLQCNPPGQNLCEDLSDLQHMNECGVLNTLICRARAHLPLTHAGPNLVSFWPPIQTHSKVRSSKKKNTPQYNNAGRVEGFMGELMRQKILHA